MKNQYVSPADERYKEARAKREELKVEEIQSKLIKKDSVLKLFRMNNALVRSKLADIPNSLAGILTNQSDAGYIFSIIKGEIDAALHHVSELVKAQTKDVAIFSEGNINIKDKAYESFLKKESSNLIKNIQASKKEDIEKIVFEHLKSLMG